ncbi:AAA family ATPase [Rhizobium sp. CFBP 8762]|uniref:AAA family ATPase n=1 Tax=Rhizobium sp. CFBP 8762 TaxID=2775279 RepID=UPI0017869877|nr:AAA family ATPase [Rhizobium sp. CFBP 8762]MBD8556847.1 AAA family ATPase [Rhizobium sp. CFBP 8762]
MIFIGGASGTGKTTFLERFVNRHPSFSHARASTILKNHGRPTYLTSAEEFEENQRVLRRFLVDTNLSAKTLLDGHMVVRAGRQLLSVPDSFFDGLRVTAFVFLWTEAWRICARKCKSPEIIEEADIHELQQVEFAHMHAAAARTGRPIECFNSMQVFEIEQALLQYGLA